MSDDPAFLVRYDRRSDTLYIAKSSAAASRGIEDEKGIVWRYNSEGDLIGITIMDFYDVWAGEEDVLAEQIAKSFHISGPQAHVVVDQALSLHE